jgi:hypothetical protein
MLRKSSRNVFFHYQPFAFQWFRARYNQLVLFDNNGEIFDGLGQLIHKPIYNNAVRVATHRNPLGTIIRKPHKLVKIIGLIIYPTFTQRSLRILKFKAKLNKPIQVHPPRRLVFLLAFHLSSIGSLMASGRLRGQTTCNRNMPHRVEIVEIPSIFEVGGSLQPGGWRQVGADCGRQFWTVGRLYDHRLSHRRKCVGSLGVASAVTTVMTTGYSGLVAKGEGKLTALMIPDQNPPAAYEPSRRSQSPVPLWKRAEVQEVLRAVIFLLLGCPSIGGKDASIKKS